MSAAHSPLEALRVAEGLESKPLPGAAQTIHISLIAARLLREQHAEIQQLRAVLHKLVRAVDRLPGNNPLEGLADEARAAIAKATSEPA